MRKMMAYLITAIAVLFVCGTFCAAAETGEIKGGAESEMMTFSYAAATADSAAHREVVYSGTVSMVRGEVSVYIAEEPEGEISYADTEEDDRVRYDEVTSENDAEQEETASVYTADEEENEEALPAEDDCVFTDPEHLPDDEDGVIGEDIAEESEDVEEEDDDFPEEGEAIETREMTGETEEESVAENSDYIIDGSLNDDYFDEEDPLYVDDFFCFEEDWIFGDSESQEFGIYDEQDVDDSFGDGCELAEYESESEGPDAEDMEAGGSRAD